MLKPHYSRKQISKNYTIGHGHGNDYFDFKGTRRINELLINGYSVRFIPHYNMQEFPFPPTLDSFNQFMTRMPRNMQETRVCCFEKADVVFFEYNEKAGSTFDYEYERYFRDLEQLEKKQALIHCIDSELFKSLTDEMQKKMPYIFFERKLRHHMKRSDMEDLKFVQFLDAKFLALKDRLPEKFRLSLEL